MQHARRALVLLGTTIAWSTLAVGACTHAETASIVAPEAAAETSAPADAGADAVDAAPPTCALQGDKCVGDPACCGPFRGQLADFDAGCLTKAAIIIDCEKFGAGCVYASSRGCFFRVVDGKREVF